MRDSHPTPTASDTTPAPAPLTGEAERRAIERFVGFFAEITEERVRAQARDVYAPDAHFDDTLKILKGAQAIEEDFVKSARKTQQLRVAMDDIATHGENYYFRWTMTMAVKGLKGGKPLLSQGISHIRFDRQGRVVYHRDYWDAAGNLFEHFPLVGALLRSIRKRL